jgi:glycerol-3-phosphate O-acyltransferase
MLAHTRTCTCTRTRTQVTLGTGDAAAAEAKSVAIFKNMIKTYAQQLSDPYEFPSYHTAMRSPFDYYTLGNEYVGALVDWRRSVLRHEARWSTIEAQLAAGENVILLANHQSEADAAFIPLLTAASHPKLGEQVIYVAGDRVVTDLMAKPFSMGRNLLCVHSKKHIDDDLALKPAKQKQNLRTLKEMERLLRAGGMLLWIAPAGGRDRRRDGLLAPDAFDPGAVEMMRRLGTKKGGAVTHYYPFAMATYEVMPPPASLEKSLGEKREVRFTGVGLSVAEEVDVSDKGAWAAALPADATPEVRQAALASHVQAAVAAEFAVISGCMGTGGDFPLPPGCSRPWLK